MPIFTPTLQKYKTKKISKKWFYTENVHIEKQGTITEFQKGTLKVQVLAVLTTLLRQSCGHLDKLQTLAVLMLVFRKCTPKINDWLTKCRQMTASKALFVFYHY